MTTIVTRAGKGSALTHTELDNNFTNLNTDKVEASGDSMTGNLSFGDNNKAIFGAGSDLQIYHDGTNSYVRDSGSGNLRLQANTVDVVNAANTEYSARFIEDGKVGLYYDGIEKLATTTTGIDVTGTVTADGLTVDAANTYLKTTGFTHTLNFNTTTGTQNTNAQISSSRTDISTTKSDLKFKTNDGTSTLTRVEIDELGDISFYEDTGTTAKFFWDASAETLTVPELVGAVTATTVVSDGIDLSAISDSIADTAVDVFVYDTSKDSDGGAWRKRTQHTSWYNETLNTATRGSRREFPAVAVIVAEAGKVTIYDGDDPSLPMWMVFIGSWSLTTGTMLVLASTTNAPITSLFMVNGKLCVGSQALSNPDACGSHIIDFIIDKAEVRGRLYSALLNHNGIIERNSPKGLSDIAVPTLINASVNDVAMTVLPNAPIDQATGLPIPTIAVATDGGVSVITDSGVVYDITGQTDTPDHVDFNADNEIVTGWQYVSQVGIYDIPSSDISYSSDKRHYRPTVGVPPLGDNAAGVLHQTSSAFGKNDRLTLLAENKTDSTQTMVGEITSSHNTGWMQGDIKGAWLSDTDDTDVTGTELVTNGTFDTNTSGWVISGATAQIVSGEVELTSTIAFGGIYQEFLTEVGKTYQISLTSRRSTAFQARARVYNNDLTTIHATLDNTTASNLSQTATFVATSTVSRIKLEVGDSTVGKIVYFDNISLRLAEPDRSVNNNGLAVYGTVTKTPVATGADLVAYSGFSASNYLQQPYNSDLDFGTGDFYVMGWFKEDTLDPLCYLFSRDTSPTTENINVYVQSGQLTFKLDDNSSNYLVHVSGASVAGSWQHFVGIKNGNTAYVYINGQQKASLDVSTMGSLTNTSAVTCLGISAYITSPLDSGSLALWRVGAGAPSAEQVAKIYEDEKVLFQDGAQATLYGSSDAVTALAYDDDTNLLHVGTSAGRSVFQGLKRVDNTTTAVGAAISASNGLVAEE